MRQSDTAAERILYSLSAILGKELRIVDSHDNARDEQSMMLPSGDLRVTSSDGALTQHERAIIREMFELLRNFAVASNALTEVQQRVTMLERDNLDLMVKNRMLSEISARDALTGLYNRWFVIEKIEAEINRSLRSGTPLSLMMLDIDHFKYVNDTFGHSAGDLVLQSVARMLKESCRVYDIPGRYGGEEFCVLLPDTKLNMTPGVAERIRSRFESTEFAVGDQSLVVTASIGIAGLDAGDGDAVLSPAMLIDRADRALYAAKRHGRNRVELWDATLTDSRPAVTDH